MGRFLNDMGLGEDGEFRLIGDRVTMSQAYRLTKNPKAQDRTKHIDVQCIISPSQSIQTNCMLPEYRTQTSWLRDPQRPSPLAPLKGSGSTVTRLTRVRSFSRQCREALARDEVTNAFRIICVV